MSARGEGAGPRRAWARAIVTLLPLSLFLLAAVSTAGCGGSSAPQVAAYAGVWQRVVAGQPDPTFTLQVERNGADATLTFTQPSGYRAQGAAKLQDGCLVMGLPADNGIVDGTTSLQLSLDAGGQLVVDRVLSDGTTEPMWMYDRAPSVAPQTGP